uniref:Coatomer subunit zeta n=1 Tax=Kalanchoe fedtschenkoi TaxID=63787 RepID=A0A7N0RFS0_KALFE
MELIPVIKNILLLDKDGRRVAVKYYTDEWPTVSDQKEFETAVMAEVRKDNPQVLDAEEERQKPLHAGTDQMLLLGNNLVAYNSSKDLYFFVTGGEDENEELLSFMLQGVYEALLDLSGTYGIREGLDKKWVLQNFVAVFMCLDGFVDRGLILETEGEVILDG